MAPTRRPPPAPRKVYTPGSAPPGSARMSRGRGRPKKAKERVGSKRLGNYRHKYKQETLELAIAAVKEENMPLKRAAKLFQADCKAMIFHI